MSSPKSPTVCGDDRLVDPNNTYNYYEANRTRRLPHPLKGSFRRIVIPRWFRSTITAGLDDAPISPTTISKSRSLLQRLTMSRSMPIGDLSINHEFSTISEEDLKTGESVGIVAALVILVIVFGALVAAGVPILLGIFSIAIATGLAAIVGRTAWISRSSCTNMITMIGLAVGIDYALFIVERYREERRHGRDKLEAIEIAGATASKAVLFSGMTVVLALFGLFLIPTTSSAASDSARCWS